MLLKAANAELKEYEQVLVDQHDYIKELQAELENWKDDE